MSILAIYLFTDEAAKIPSSLALSGTRGKQNNQWHELRDFMMVTGLINKGEVVMQNICHKG